MGRLFCILALAICLSCTTNSLPRQSTSEYFRTTGGAFIANLQQKSTQYFITLNVLRDIEIGSKLVVNYQNPSGDPLQYVEVITEKKKNLILKSSPIQGLVHNTAYSVEIKLYAKDGKLLCEHKQAIFY